MTAEYSGDIEKRLEETALIFDFDLKEVREKFKEIRESPQVVSSTAYRTPEERDIWSLKATRAFFHKRPKTAIVSCVPVGFRESKAGIDGVYRSEIYALFPEEDKGDPRVRRIGISHNPDIFKEISFNPPHIYDAELSVFKGGDYAVLDGRSKFENPRPAKVEDPLDFIKRITIAEAPDNLADTTEGRGGARWAVTTDWRCIRGLITYTNQGRKKAEEDDKSSKKDWPWASFELYDDSGRAEGPEGRMVDGPNTLTVWCSQQQLFSKGDEVEAFGTISRQEDSGVHTMQAYWVKQIFQFNPTEEEKEFVPTRHPAPAKSEF